MTLPRGWIESTLGECSETIQYGLTAKSRSDGSGFRYVRITDIQAGQIAWSGVPFAEATEQQCESSRIAPGDILFARTGATVGKSQLVDYVPGPASFASYLIRVRCNQCSIHPRFAGWFMRSSNYWEQILSGAEGTGQPNFNGSKLAALKLPVPPLAEQRRIVAELDLLAARIARTRAELDRVPMLASNLRKESLRLAFNGALTARWRGDANAPKSERAIPSTWRSVCLGAIADIKSGLTLGKKREPSDELIELPYLRVANVQRGSLDLRTIKRVSVTPREAESLYLQAGDILMNEGGDRDKLGRGCVWNEEVQNCIHQNHVFRVRLFALDAIPQYISQYANEFGSEYFFENGTQTTNLASLSKTKLSALPIPLAPVNEQAEILSRLKAAFARADRLEAEAARATKLLDRLEASILAKAFRGELVPQNPSDEPASVLLDRIRADRSAAPKPKRGRRSPTNAGAA